MDFENAYKKYQEGNATAEETAYVKEVLDKAKELTDIPAPPEYNAVPAEEAVKIKKFFRIKTIIKSVLIAVVSLFLCAGIICGIIFGISVPAAKKSATLNKLQAHEAALAYVAARPEEYGVRPIVEDVDRHFELETPLRDSYYEYFIDIETNLYELKLRVNTATGEITCRIDDHND